MIFANNTRNNKIQNNGPKKATGRKVDKWGQHDMNNLPWENQLVDSGMDEHEYVQGGSDGDDESSEEGGDEECSEDQSNPNLSVIREERENSTVIFLPFLKVSTRFCHIYSPDA